MEITTAYPDIYFKVFYYAAFALIFVAVLIHAIRKKYPLRTILLLLSSLMLFTIIGTRLFTIPVSEWLASLTGQAVVDTTNRSAIGGLLFGLVGLLIMQRIFRLDRSLLVLIAWLVPIGLAIQKVGCFINGCCFGTHSELPWAVHYGADSNAHFAHWNANLIGDAEMLSHSIHPVQLYESVFLTLIAILIWKTRHRWKKGVSMLFFGLGLIFTFRFGIEFLRDPMSSQFSEIYFLGIRSFQWMLLGVGIAMLILARTYDRSAFGDLLIRSNKQVEIRSEIWYALALSMIIYCFSQLLVSYELWTIWTQFSPAILLIFIEALKRSSTARYKVLSVFVFLLPAYVMAQTVKIDTIEKKRYKRVEITGAFGDYYNQILSNPQSTGGGGCGGGPGVTYQNQEEIESTFSAFGAGFAQVSQKGKNTLEFGGRAHFGGITTSSISNGTEESVGIWSVGPYVKYDMNWFGFGAGVQFGSMRFYDEETFMLNTGVLPEYDDLFKKRTVNPDFYIRVGPRKWFDIDYNYGFLAPSPLPLLQHRLSAGTTFGGSNFSIRGGQFYPLNSGFVSGEVLIQDRIGVHVMYVFKEEYDFGNIDPSPEFVIGLNYRFDIKNN